MRVNYLYSCVLLVLAGITASSCGGNDSTASTNSGRLAIRIDWPARGRLVPDACESIKITVLAGEDLVAERVIPRPMKGGTTETTITSLPPISVLIRAEAMPTGEGTGTPQAQGTVPITLVANQVVPASITMASTITEVKLTAEHHSVQISQSTTLTASAFDAEERLVLTSPSKWSWSASNSSVSLAPSGLTCEVTGHTLGSAEVQALETESQRHRTVQIDVTSGVPTAYTITEVCPLGTESYGNGLNNLGHVVGQFRENGNNKPFVNRGSGPEPLPVSEFPNFQAGEAKSINDSGKITGGVMGQTVVWYPDGSHGVLLHAGQSFPLGIGSNGQVVGVYRSSWIDEFGVASWLTDDSPAVLYRQGQGGFSIALNDVGAVAYALYEGGVFNGYLNDGTEHVLQGSGTTLAVVVKAMNATQIVGQIGTKIAIWTGTALQTLSDGGAAGINKTGVVVGTTALGEPKTGFIYTPETGVVDLLGKVSNATGWRDLYPMAINDQGQITGIGMQTSGVLRAFLLTPN